MTKKQRELQAQINVKLAEVENLRKAENPDEAAVDKALDEVEDLQKQFDREERVAKALKKGVPTEDVQVQDDEGAKVDGTKALADAARRGFKSMNEGTPADGGYTVPEDILTRVNEFKQARFSLATLIDRESVSTNSGRRTYKTRAQHTGFAKVGEGGKIGKTSAPKFEIMEYTIEKYAGFLPVTNELLADSDAAIAQTVIDWLGEEGVATENSEIIALVNRLEATPVTGIKDIKTAITKTLALYRTNAKIVTNSDGILYLDTLEDKNGRPLLSPDPTKPMEMYLSVGTRRIPVVEVPNEILPTAESGAIPFWMGDLYEYAKMFDRQQLSISQSDVAAIGDFNAYEQDMTLFRGIMRADFETKDVKALVRGELTVTA